MPSGTERSKEGERERSADESLGALAADSGDRSPHLASRSSPEARV